MSKIYFVAINWELLAKDKDGRRFVITTQATNGNDIAGFTECYRYKDGWRIYPFTTKKARNSLVDETLNKRKEQ